MYCASCGKQQPKDGIFFPYCGAKHSVGMYENSNCIDNNNARTTADNSGNLLDSSNYDFPVNNLDPLVVIEKSRWTFRYADSNNAPPDWVGCNVDFLITQDYVVIQSAEEFTPTEKKLNKAAEIGPVALSVVPIVGVTVATAMFAFEVISGRSNKFVGYGKKNQLTKNSILQNFASGRSIWAKKTELEFRSISTKAGIFRETYYFLVVAGSFHHLDGVFDSAAITLSNADTQMEFEKRGSCRFATAKSFKLQSEAFRSLKEYPLPPVTTESDDAWYK